MLGATEWRFIAATGLLQAIATLGVFVWALRARDLVEARNLAFSVLVFGELFRALSLEQVGAAAWLSRAAAGIAKGKLIVTLPGSPAGVELALKRLLLPELAHAMRALGRFPNPE